MTREEFEKLARKAGGEAPAVVIEVAENDDLDLALTAAMQAFGEEPTLATVGVDISGERLLLDRAALYKHAADALKGFGGAGGSSLPGRPGYQATVFCCPQGACTERRVRYGHRQGDPPPHCPQHDQAMVEK